MSLDLNNVYSTKAILLKLTYANQIKLGLQDKVVFFSLT